MKLEVGKRYIDCDGDTMVIIRQEDSKFVGRVVGSVTGSEWFFTDHGAPWSPREQTVHLVREAKNHDPAGQPGSHDSVNHPKHYVSHKSGVECIEITRHMGFNLGNAMKYIWRADLKNDALEDLRKAAWYIADEIAKREKQS